MQVNNSFNTETSNYINDNKNNVEKVLSKIVASRELSGQDNASLLISNALSSQISTLTQSIQNSNDSIGMYQVVDGALKELSIGSDTLNDISVRFNNDALNASQKNSLQKSFADTVKSMEDIASQTSYNGQNLFNSSLGLELSGLDTLSIDNQQGITDFQGSLTSLNSEVSSQMKSYEVGIANALSAVSNLTSANAQIAETPLEVSVNNLSQNQLKLDSSMMAQVHQTSLMQQKISTLLS